jgi:hypothetical protein
MRSDRTSMATWKRLTIIGKSLIDIDLDTIAFMCSNGKGTEIHFNSGDTDCERKPGSGRQPKKSDATQARPQQL